jgi:hypothetical protein
MATNSDLIDRALRKLNVVALGQTTPQGDQANALVVLQALYGEWYAIGVFGRNMSLPSSNLTDPPALGMEFFDGVACALAVRLWTDYSGDKTPNPSVQDGADKLEAALMAGQGEQGGAPTTTSLTIADISYGAARRLIGVRANMLSVYQQQVLNDAGAQMFREWRNLGYLGRNVAIPNLSPVAPCPVGDSYGEGATAVLATRVATALGVQKVPDDATALAEITIKELASGAYEQTGNISTAARTITDIAYGAARRLIGLRANALNDYQLQALNDAALSMFAEWRDLGFYGVNAPIPALSLSAPCPVGETYADGATAVLATRVASVLGVDSISADVEALAKRTLDELTRGAFIQAGAPTTAPRTVGDVMRAAARRLLGLQSNQLNVYQQQVLQDAARAMFLDWGNRGYYGRDAPQPSVTPTDVCPVGDTYFDGAAASLALRVANDLGVDKVPDATAALAQGTVKQLEEGQAQSGLTTNGVKTVSDLIYAASRKLVKVQAGSLSLYQLQVGVDALQSLYMELVSQGAFGRLWDFFPTPAYSDGGERIALSPVLDPGMRNPSVQPLSLQWDADLAATSFTPLEQMRVCCPLDNMSVVLPSAIPIWWRGCGDWGGSGSFYPYASSWSAAAWWGLDPNGSTARPPRDGACIEVIAPSSTATWAYDAQTQAWVQLNALQLTDPAPLAARHYNMLACALAVRMAPEMDAQVRPEVQRGAALTALTHRFDSREREAVGLFF